MTTLPRTDALITAGLARSDRDAIRELRARFATAATRYNHDAFAMMFAAGGVWEIPGMQAHFRGRDAIRGAVEQMLPLWDGGALVTRDGPITRTRDGAIGRTCLDEQVEGPVGGWRRDVAYYDDVYVREGGRWLFARRTYHVLDRRRRTLAA